MQEQKANIAENLLTLRRRLKMTQKEFIGTYLVDTKGRPLISVSTLSNVENGSQTNVERLAQAVADELGVDSASFSLAPDLFAKNAEVFFQSVIQSGTPGKISQTLQLKKTSTVESLVQLLSNYVMNSIIGGKLNPGDKLPSDRELSTRFGVGRTAVREALKALSTLGLIRILPGQGTFIATEPTDFYLMPLSWTFLIGQNNTNHIIDVRNVLEIEAVKLAAYRADAKCLQELSSGYRQMALAYQNADFKAFLDLDVNFHLTIAKCSGNPLIFSLLQTSRKLLSYISKSGMVTVDHLSEIYKEHSEIFTAIDNHEEGRAMQAMENHLENARKRYKI